MGATPEDRKKQRSALKGYYEKCLTAIEKMESDYCAEHTRLYNESYFGRSEEPSRERLATIGVLKSLCQALHQEVIRGKVVKFDKQGKISNFKDGDSDTYIKKHIAALKPTVQLFFGAAQAIYRAIAKTYYIPGRYKTSSALCIVLDKNITDFDKFATTNDSPRARECFEEYAKAHELDLFPAVEEEEQADVLVTPVSTP